MHIDEFDSSKFVGHWVPVVEQLRNVLQSSHTEPLDQRSKQAKTIISTKIITFLYKEYPKKK
jgi:hypothetical protein